MRHERQSLPLQPVASSPHADDRHDSFGRIEVNLGDVLIDRCVRVEAAANYSVSMQNNSD